MMFLNIKLENIPRKMISQNYPKNSQNPRKIDPQKNDLYFSHRNQMRSLKNNMGKRHQK
jgi:hypothetical protein